jgi:hypothetical protein
VPLNLAAVRASALVWYEREIHEVHASTAMNARASPVPLFSSSLTRVLHGLFPIFHESFSFLFWAAGFSVLLWTPSILTYPINKLPLPSLQKEIIS